MDLLFSLLFKSKLIKYDRKKLENVNFNLRKKVGLKPTISTLYQKSPK